MDAGDGVIRVAPTTPAGQVLACLVALGDVTAERIADDLYPRPRLTDSRKYPAWLRELATWLAGRPERVARVSRLLGRLQSARLVERQGPPRIALGVPDPMSAAWLQRVRAAARLDDVLADADDYFPGGASAPFPGAVALDIVARIRAGARTVGEAVPDDGHAWRVYGELVALDVVIPPSVRRATEAGRAVVAGWASMVLAELASGLLDVRGAA